VDERARDLKKQWKAAEKSAARAQFPLPNDKLEAMFDAVESSLENDGCDHSSRATIAWLTNMGFDVDTVVQWLENNGGFCDCEVVANARDHFEENRG
jgi:hypothetical protein